MTAKGMPDKRIKQKSQAEGFLWWLEKLADHKQNTRDQRSAHKLPGMM